MSIMYIYKMIFQYISTDIIMVISEHLCIRDLVKLLLCKKQWSTIIKDNGYWKQLLLYHYSYYADNIDCYKQYKHLTGVGQNGRTTIIVNHLMDKKLSSTYPLTYTLNDGFNKDITPIVRNGKISFTFSIPHVLRLATTINIDNNVISGIVHTTRTSFKQQLSELLHILTRFIDKVHIVTLLQTITHLFTEYPGSIMYYGFSRYNIILVATYDKVVELPIVEGRVLVNKDIYMTLKVNIDTLCDKFSLTVCFN